VGEFLTTKWTDGEYYPGEVTQVLANNYYSFTFTDNDFLARVHANEIRNLTKSEEESWGEKEESEDESEDESGDESGEESGEESREEREAAKKKNKKDEKEEESEYQFYYNALLKFLKSLLKNHEGFLHGKMTSNTESFHNVCNKYYHKGQTMSFEQYVMRKQFAGFDWVEMREKKLDFIQDWQELIMDLLIKRIEENNKINYSLTEI
jgi:hypothetical protein